MKVRKTFIVIMFVVLLQSAHGQGFENLDFESTTITPVIFPGETRYTATVPSWTWTPGGNFVNGDPNSVGFNELALDSAAVTLQGTTSPFAPAIQGMYSILLQGGSVFDPDTSGASIGQTGQIPVNALSLVFWGSSMDVSFGGQNLSLVVLETTPNYNIYGADISAFAGQTGQLLFTMPWQSSGLLDNIQFSSSSVPEPSELSLGALCALLFGLHRWKARAI